MPRPSRRSSQISTDLHQFTSNRNLLCDELKHAAINEEKIQMAKWQTTTTTTTTTTTATTTTTTTTPSANSASRLIAESSSPADGFLTTKNESSIKKIHSEDSKGNWNFLRRQGRDSHSDIPEAWNQTLTCRLPGRKRVRAYYESFIVQVSVAALIFLNFAVACTNAQIRPKEGTIAKQIFNFFEHFFAWIFLVELAVNMYGSWFRRFWKAAWNWFDFTIVIISIMSLFLANLPGVSVLRLFRAFRVFRLFKRVPSLRIIIEGVGASMIGVSNAFMILGILMGIWAIIGVEFFGSGTSQYFGTFLRAMFSLFQVMSMDSWCSNIARSITYAAPNNTLGYPDTGLPSYFQFPIAVYFISFLIVGGIVMMNVVVAILLERYLEATKQEAQIIRGENELKCFTSRREWKKIPKKERVFHQFHKPIEIGSCPEYAELIDDVDINVKDLLLYKMRIALDEFLWDAIDVIEARHIMKILWLEHGNRQFMKKVIEKHKNESWVHNVNEPSFLLNVLFQGTAKYKDE